MTTKKERAEALARMTKAELIKTIKALDVRQTKLLNEVAKLQRQRVEMKAMATALLPAIPHPDTPAPEPDWQQDAAETSMLPKAVTTTLPSPQPVENHFGGSGPSGAKVCSPPALGHRVTQPVREQVMSQETDRQRSRPERIARLERRLAAIAEDDAKNRITDPVVSVLKGVLDLLKDETK